jgi:hypothetical protein
MFRIWTIALKFHDANILRIFGIVLITFLHFETKTLQSQVDGFSTNCANIRAMIEIQQCKKPTLSVCVCVCVCDLDHGGGWLPLDRGH